MSIIKPEWIDVELPPIDNGVEGFSGCLPLDEAELMGDVPRIELFARSHADGWDCWGDEA